MSAADPTPRVHAATGDIAAGEVSVFEVSVASVAGGRFEDERSLAGAVLVALSVGSPAPGVLDGDGVEAGAVAGAVAGPAVPSVAGVLVVSGVVVFGVDVPADVPVVPGFDVEPAPGVATVGAAGAGAAGAGTGAASGVTGVTGAGATGAGAGATGAGAGAGATGAGAGATGAGATGTGAGAGSGAGT